MFKDKYIDISNLTTNKNVLRLFNIVETHGGVLRFVGGAVRDAIAGLKGFDLDLATDLSPDELVEICEENGIKTIPIGIKFGTLGVVIDNQVLEVTSLRKDIKTDGRHAEVVFTSDWEEDASRRDLTINAVYADEKGNVFDYYNGVDDLEKGIVRFIGNANQRIKEDYLRILRFFRFYSVFSKTEIDRKALEACIENKDGLKTLSMERIRDELFKILLTPKAAETVKIISDNDILGYVLPNIRNDDKLDFLIKKVNLGLVTPCPLRRIFVLYDPDPDLAENMANRMKFSKKQKGDFISWAENKVSLLDFGDRKKLARMIYKFGKDFALNKLLIEQALQTTLLPNNQEIISFIDTTEIPVFPLRGKDILETGSIEDNRLIGDILDKLEEKWMDSNFTLGREELLSQVPLVKSAS